jgi:CheY-like chemotaxis protein
LIGAGVPAMEKNKQPAKRGGRPTRGAGGAARSVRPTGIPVLHIEDDPNDRELLQTAVVEAGVPFQVHSTSDAGQAIAFLRGANSYGDRRRFPLPRLILLDLKMPGSSGMEVLAWVRSHPELNRVPVIVLSGSESEEDMRQAYACGANAYIVKPLGFTALVEMIKGVNLGWFVAPQNGSPGIQSPFRASSIAITSGRPSSARP